MGATGIEPVTPTMSMSPMRTNRTHRQPIKALSETRNMVSHDDSRRFGVSWKGSRQTVRQCSLGLVRFSRHANRNVFRCSAGLSCRWSALAKGEVVHGAVAVVLNRLSPSEVTTGFGPRCDVSSADAALSSYAAGPSQNKVVAAAKLGAHFLILRAERTPRGRRRWVHSRSRTATY